ncbi:MAG: hypothetical protein F4X20_08770 [Dehalococcoidia bacterium]|nr:hypothetical protein [Dehalococcoidia bacterium]
MIPAIEQHSDEIRRLCIDYRVQTLSLFGSSASLQDDDAPHDLDFLVEFKPEAIDNYADAYFGLLDALKRLFGKPVDLVVESAIRNPHFLESIKRTRTELYAP